MATGSNRFSVVSPRAFALAVAVTCVAATAASLHPDAAVARDKTRGAVAGEPGFFEYVGRWFDEQADNIRSTFNGTRSTVEEFGREAGMAASKTVDGASEAARGAADAVARLPAPRVVSGHEKCRVAPNGAPDCGAAADALCRVEGFRSGSSVDMTTAEVCPPRVWLAGRSTGPGCHTETFVSRALCR